MSTREQLYQEISYLSEGQMQELLAFVRGMRPGNTPSEVQGILSAYARPELTGQEKEAWERAVTEKYEDA